MNPTEVPAWKDDFPVSWVDDHYVTRREFTKSLVLVSCAAFGANGALVGMGAWERARRTEKTEPLRVARVDELPVGGSKVFGYPVPEEPCLLLRLAPDRFAAFGQKCTHLGCPVLYRAEKNLIAGRAGDNDEGANTQPSRLTLRPSNVVANNAPVGVNA